MSISKEDLAEVLGGLEVKVYVHGARYGCCGSIDIELMAEGIVLTYASIDGDEIASIMADKGYE